MDKQADTYMTRWYNHKHNYTVYNDLTGTSLQWSAIRVTILKCPYFRLVVSQWFLYIHTPYHTCCTAHNYYTVSFCTLDDVRAHTCQGHICTYIDTWMKEKHTDQVTLRTYTITSYICICMRKLVYTYIHTHICNSYIYIYIDTHTHIHKYKYI